MFIKHHKPILDLLECWFYTATENSPNVSDNNLLKIDDALNMLAQHPDSRLLRPELDDELRSFPVAGYALFYKHYDKQLNLIRMLHGTMDAGLHL